MDLRYYTSVKLCSIKFLSQLQSQFQSRFHPCSYLAYIPGSDYNPSFLQFHRKNSYKMKKHICDSYNIRKKFLATPLRTRMPAQQVLLQFSLKLEDTFQLARVISSKPAELQAGNTAFTHRFTREREFYATLECVFTKFCYIRWFQDSSNAPGSKMHVRVCVK